MASLPDVPRMARDALFVSVGLGLLGVNQVQVRRRELAADLRRLAGSGPLSVVLGGDRNEPRGGQQNAAPGGTPASTPGDGPAAAR